MAHRYTIKELNEKTELELLYLIVNDRYGSVTNRDSPLAIKLDYLLKKISKMIDKGKGEI